MKPAIALITCKTFKFSISRVPVTVIITSVTIKAIGERDNKKKKISNDNLEVNVSAEGDEIYICNTCNNNCDWDPADTELESLACDKCNCWFHYKCAELTGEEAYLN
jgi:DNA-directed RNA polymerase subunit RPC12/RpoP